MELFIKSFSKIYKKINDILILTKFKRDMQKLIPQFSHPYKLHLGCGKVRLSKWINIDLDESSGGADIVWDLTRGIPLDDASCQLIYCEHLLEHFTVEEGLALLRECRRVLEAEGILRVAVPSLDVIIEKSASGNWKDQEWLSWPEYGYIQTRAEMLNMAFRAWGHKWLYDREELHRRLHEAGFTRVKDVEWGGSEEVELKNRETRRDSLLICEAQK